MSARKIQQLRTAMRASYAALGRDPEATRAAWIKASADYYLALHPDDAKWRPVPDEALPTVEEIRSRAEVADRAHKAIPPLGRIDPDPEKHDAWSAQLGWLEETLRGVFTDTFKAAEAAIKAGDRSGLEYCVRFIEADPWCFRSGYTKARLIPAIAKFELDEALRKRLARALIAVVDDPRRRREIRKYGSLAIAVRTTELVAQLEQRAASVDPYVRFNARLILERLGA